MPSTTTNYKFPKYEASDAPDLTGAYNSAVDAIDAKIKEVADSVPSSPESVGTFDGTAPTVTVEQLAKNIHVDPVKGILYYHTGISTMG